MCSHLHASPALHATSGARFATRGVARFALVGALGLLGACAAPGDSHLVNKPAAAEPIRLSAPAGTSGSLAALTLIVSHDVPALPPRRAQLPAPSPQHVWVAGYWIWRDYEYEWCEEHWELPPRSGARWIAPRWVQRGTAYRFYVGHWN